MSTKEHKAALKMVESLQFVADKDGWYTLSRNLLLAMLRQAYLLGEDEGIRMCREVLNKPNYELKENGEKWQLKE